MLERVTEKVNEKKKNGFTLMEGLIACGIALVIAVIVLSSYL